MNKSVNTFAGLDQQNTPEEFLQKIVEDMIFNMREQPLDPEAYIRCHKIMN